MIAVNPRAQALINYRKTLKSIGYRLPRNRRVPRPLQPTGIERDYYQRIIELIEPLFSQVQEKFIPALPQIIRQYKEETRVDSGVKAFINHIDSLSDDEFEKELSYAGLDVNYFNQQRTDMVMGYGQLITRTIADIKINIARQIPEELIQREAENIAHRTAAFNKAQINRQFQSVLGINPLLTERWMGPKVAAFVEQNVSLIKSIPEQFFSKIEGMVRNTVEHGISTRKLEGEILEDFGGMIHNQLEMTRSRAHLIAKDQIAKYNSSLHELRQREAGVTKYIWSTSKDERVRPKHAAMEGKIVSWDDPPPVGVHGEKLHVGQDYQ